MADLWAPALILLVVGTLAKLVDNVLDRRKSGATSRRADEENALKQIQAVWAELRQLKIDQDAEIKQLREEYQRKIAELETQIELYKHRTGAAVKKALEATKERDALLREIGPLKIEVDQLRRRVKELEDTSHG